MKGTVRMKSVVELITKLAEPVVLKNDCVLWDVEFVKEAGQRYLRVYIDNDQGVTIDQCEAVSRELEKLIDEADPIEQSYIFEVSSAGAERALKRPSDFEKFMGSNVAIKLYASKNGRKEYVGTLTGYSGGDVDIVSKGKPLHFDKSEIASVRLQIDF
jgi:ribosome maturation factor RimP